MGEHQSYDVIATNQLTVIAVITQRYLAGTVLKALQMLAYFTSLTREPGRGCREREREVLLYSHKALTTMVTEDQNQKGSIF